MSKILYAQDIIRNIPHRYPFLLIDRVEVIEDGKKAVGIKCVSANELFFHGHFPQRPIMPGVLILEAMAQTLAAMMMDREDLRGKFAYFAGVNKARFKRQVIPGDVLELEVELKKMRSKIVVASGKAVVNKEIACEAELLFAID